MLEKAYYDTKGPLSIAEECLLQREKRQGIDQVHDHVEKNLSKVCHTHTHIHMRRIYPRYVTHTHTHEKNLSKICHTHTHTHEKNISKVCHTHTHT